MSDKPIGQRIKRTFLWSWLVGTVVTLITFLDSGMFYDYDARRGAGHEYAFNPWLLPLVPMVGAVLAFAVLLAWGIVRDAVLSAKHGRSEGPPYWENYPPPGA